MYSYRNHYIKIDLLNGLIILENKKEHGLFLFDLIKFFKMLLKFIFIALSLRLFKYHYITLHKRRM